jgi:hypothetical protein
MPTIVNQTLSIRPTGTSARVTIEFEIVWDEHERRSGQEYFVRAEMRGEDGTIFDPDDHLFNINFPFLTDGTEVQRVRRESLAPLRDLNEDSGQDEVYANLTITPVRVFGSASARTNTVRGSF